MAYKRAGLTLLAGQTYEAGPRLWAYTHTDAYATVEAANYIADAKLKGMKVGDIVFVTQMTGAAVTAVTIGVVLSVTATGANLSDGTAISTADL